MNSLTRVFVPLSVLAVAASALSAGAASYDQVINNTRTATEAKGSNSVVVQVEVSSASKSGQRSSMNYAPDLTDSQFKNVDIQVHAAAKSSVHSNTVGQLFFGSKRSIAKGISTAHIYRSSAWLARLGHWDLDPTHISQLFPGPIVNHSWVSNPKSAGRYLRRADYSALSNNILHVAGVRRRGLGENLMAGGYNSIVVGGAVQNIETPYPVLDEFYAGGRTRPHLVGPYPHASAAAPIIAAAAVRLNALAADRSLRFSTAERANSEQLPVELVKAILMASASPDFQFKNKGENLVNGFGTLGVTDNGLDKRYGMGMLNVDDAEELLLAMPGGSVSKGSGGDFRGLKSSEVQSYTVKPRRAGKLTASLVWLADLKPEGNDLVGSLYDFDLELVQVSSGGASQSTEKSLTSSTATLDTTENLRFDVEPGNTYELRVSRKSDKHAETWDYAIAWNLAD